VSVLLDTNVCIAFLRGDDPAVRERLLALPSQDVILCSVVKAELLYGARNSERVEPNLNKLEHFFAPFAPAAFDDEAAAWYGIVRSQLRRSGRLIGSNDMMIAAIALAWDAVLVTRNQDEFRRVASLRVETW
jgi:tRNA(fMet)-specific endonuclease VapC